MLKAILWDYDGTLVNTAGKNFRVTANILEKVTGKAATNFKPLSSQEEYRKANEASANWRELYKNQFRLNPEQVEEAGRLWTEFQLEDDSILKLYDGISEVLASTKELFQGIISQNSKKNIIQDISKLQVEHLFSEVIGYREVDPENQKPHPQGLLKCFSKIPELKESDLVFYVGDHETDLQSVINANKYLNRKAIIFIAAMYCKENRVGDWKEEPDFVVTHPTQILDIVSTFYEDSLNEE